MRLGKTKTSGSVTGEWPGSSRASRGALGLRGVSCRSALSATRVLLGHGQGDARGSLAGFGSAVARVRCSALRAAGVVRGKHHASRQGEGIRRSPVALPSSLPNRSSLVRPRRKAGRSVAAVPAISATQRKEVVG